MIYGQGTTYIAYVQKPTLNAGMLMYPLGISDLRFGLSRLLYFVYVRSEGSGKSGYMRRLV